jgi:AraC-like DNA-binding protein
MNASDEWIDLVNTPEREILDLRGIGMRHALTLGRLLYQRAARPLEEQRHDRWLVLIFLLSGRQQYLINGEEVSLHGGEMIRILPGTTYGTGRRPEQKGELAWLIMEHRPTGGGSVLGMTEAGARAVLEMLQSPGSGPVRTMPGHLPAAIEEVFQWWEKRHDDLGAETIRNRIASIVLGATAAYTTPAGQEAHEANSNRIRRVMEKMRQNLHQPLTAEELANLSGLSPARFHFHFKRVTGTSPMDWWLRQRIEHAAHRLRAEKQLAITELAHELGFPSSQYFATVFRRYHGVSPSAYRATAPETS